MSQAQGQKIAFLVGPTFEDTEFSVPYGRLKEAGFQVDVIGTKAGEELVGDKGKERATIDKAIDQASPADYAALVIPGGGSPDKLRADQRFVRFVKEFDAAQKPLAVICHGPQLLAAAHLVKGRTLTAWATVRDDLQQMGATVRDEPVVIDGNWISSRKPEDAEQFSAAVIDALGKQGGEAGSPQGSQRP